MISKEKQKRLHRLQLKKGREAEGKVLVEGWRAVEEACASVGRLETLFLVGEASAEGQRSAIAAAARSISREVVDVTESELGQLVDTVHAQGIAAIVRTPHADRTKVVADLSRLDRALVVALDALAEPGNLGAVIRTCDWFGVDAILAGEGTVELWNPKVVRATVGSIFHLPIVERTPLHETLGELRKSGFSVRGAEVHGASDLTSLEWPAKSVLVFGNEARGISTDLADLFDDHVSIRRFGRAESLNAGIAVGIFLAAARTKTRPNTLS